MLAGVVLAGCGSETDNAADDASSGTSSSSTPPSTPASATDTTAASPTAKAAPAGTRACAEVWRAGARLPKAYSGCESGGLLGEPDGLGCSSGQMLLRHDDRFWAVRGGEIARSEGPLLDSKVYKRDLETCRG